MFFITLFLCWNDDTSLAQGSVTNPAYSSPILLIGRSNMNRAMSGDVVVVEVFPPTEWRAPGDEVIDQAGDDADEPEVEDEIDVLRKEEKVMRGKRKSDKREKQPTGRVVGMIKRSWRS
jgi:exosome complex exonuclease DIS3/RRP44